MGESHDYLVAGVGQPVQGAVPQDGVVEEAEPLPHGPVAGDDEAGDPVPADDQFVQVCRLLAGEAVQPQVVQDEQVPKPFMPDEGFKKLLDQFSPDTLAGSRRIAILMVLFTTGMRRRELWLLQTGDVDWKKAGSTSSTGKAGTPGK